MHDGHESLAGVITHFDYRSGYHTITSEDGTTTPLILSYNRKGLTYTPPIAADGTRGAKAPARLSGERAFIWIWTQEAQRCHQFPARAADV